MQRFFKESYALPNPHLSSPKGIEYVRAILKTSEKVYQNFPHDKIQWGSDSREGIDIFYPTSTGDQLPVFMFIHGGYCVNGCREMMAFLAPAVLQIPAILVLIGYKLAPAYKIVTSLEDCKTGIIKAYQHLEKHKTKPLHITLGGHSIGATFATLLLSKEHSLSSEITNTSIKNCITLGGIFNISKVPQDKRSAFLGCEEETLMWSPYNIKSYLGTTKFHLLYGEKDFLNIKEDQYPMFKKLIKSHITTLREMKNMDHFEITQSVANKDNSWWRVLKKLIQDPAS